MTIQTKPPEDRVASRDIILLFDIQQNNASVLSFLKVKGWVNLNATKHEISYEKEE